MDKNIVLIGLSGCGKSTVGKMLAKALSLPFVDMDSFIEEKEGMSVSDIFSRFGEDYFRDAESLASKELAKTFPKVIATGGGAILRLENMAALKETGVCIFLDRSPDEILKDVNAAVRPLIAQDKKRLYELDKLRRPLYERYADLTISGTSSAQKTLETILKFFK